jgi:large subunit ribosomal protein L40
LQPGIVGNGGVPLEYARAQVDGPSRQGWDHGWVRG